MTAIVNTSFIGRHYRQFTAAVLETLRSYTKGLGYVPLHEQAKFPPSIFPLTIRLATDPNNTTVESIPVKIPFPLKVWAVDLACKTAAGSACTADVQRQVAGAGAYASILAAAVDVKTGANAVTRTAPETTGCDLDYTDEIKLVVIGTGVGAVTGATATLWCQLL